MDMMSILIGILGGLVAGGRHRLRGTERAMKKRSVGILKEAEAAGGSLEEGEDHPGQGEVPATEGGAREGSARP
jgi:hypothetical protein